MDARPLAVVLILVLAGCQTGGGDSNMVWMRADGQKSLGNPAFEQQFYQADYECKRQALGSVPPPAPTMQQSISVEQTIQIGGDSYPQLPGYKPNYAQWEAAAQQQRYNATTQNLYASCMQASGYRYVPLPPE